MASIYLPNGNPTPGPKYTYKLGFMERLRVHARALLADERALVLAGDYNVIPEPEDAADASAWVNDALFLPETRSAFRALLAEGFTEALRACDPRPGLYTFWDYQAAAGSGTRVSASTTCCSRPRPPTVWSRLPCRASPWPWKSLRPRARDDRASTALIEARASDVPGATAPGEGMISHRIRSETILRHRAVMHMP